ncbi:MAG: TIGR00180 family glycosyltransferase [Planctomycetota bacterium]|jgi:glycosyltransferase domain-containing protein
MNIIIKGSGESFFNKKLAQGAFAQDVIVCRTKDEIPRDFDQSRVIAFKQRGWLLTISKVIFTAWKQKAKYVLYISDMPASLCGKVGMMVLTFFCLAFFKIGTEDTWKKNKVLKAFGDAPLRLVLSPLWSLLLVVKFFFREVLLNFILPKEDKSRPFISAGENGRTFAVLYWYTFSKRAKRNGLFGYAFDEYMGVPASLFNFPLSVFMMSKLRFRTVYLLGFLMVLAGTLSFYYFGAGFNIVAVLLVTFFLMMSNVMWEHASLGVYEILAWGFGVLAVAFYALGHGAVCGLLVGLAALSHLGAATLICFFLLAYAVLNCTFLEFLTAGTVAFFVAAYWFVPFFLRREQLTRMQMINKEWQNKHRFGNLRLMQFFTYLVFPISLFLFSKNAGLCALAAIPLLLAYYNVKIKWMYSPYTVRMFQAVVGIFCLSQAFNIYSLGFLLYFLYLPPKLLSWKNHSEEFSYNLSLSSLDDLVDKTEEFFSGLGKGDRIGFELGSKKIGRNCAREKISAFYSYFLSDKDCEIFNSPMLELIKFDIYKKTCSKFNIQRRPEPGQVPTIDSLVSDLLQSDAVFSDELRRAISISGVTAIVAYTDLFKKMLEENGFTRSKVMKFKYNYGGNVADQEAVLYAVPFLNERAWPKADVEVGSNCLKVRFAAKGDYILKYSYDFGFVCKQGTKKLELADDGNGMILVKDAEPGEAVIRYWHSRLFWPHKSRKLERQFRCTIIIPTHNRPEHLRRILSHYNEYGNDYRIIVADSSSDQNKNSNKKYICTFSDMDILHLSNYPSEIYFYDKMADAASHADGKYCVVCPDDDFVTPNGINSSIHFLENNPDFSIAHGDYLCFWLQADGAGQFQFCSRPIYPHRSLAFDDTRQRLEFHFSNYLPTQYAVHRTSFLKMALSEASKFTDDLQFGELLPSMLALIYGKMQHVVVPYAAREPSTQRRESLKDFIRSGTYEDKYRRFRECLATHLTGQSNLNTEDAGKVVDEAMFAYFSKNVMKPQEDKVAL